MGHPGPIEDAAFHVADILRTRRVLPDVQNHDLVTPRAKPARDEVADKP
jgi:hypothetical protein